MTTSPVRRILVPVDFSDSSRDALRFARALAQALGASVDVLHVMEASRGMLSGGSPEVPADDPAAARDLLRDFVASAGGPGQVPTEWVDSGHAHERIVSLAEQEGFDLIVMGTRGRTGRAHVLVGSVAETVVRNSTRPVLTVREGAR
jgi:nucleotide-binding universal stress UspA family protein